MDLFLSFVLIFFLTIAAFVYAVYENAKRQSREAAARLKLAKEAHEASLVRLKQTPTDPDLREQALANGRVYSNLTRFRRGVTVYDELALLNDINAACAAAAGAIGEAASRDSPEARLVRLAALRDKGLVSDEEYQAQRLRILGEL
jgi:cbb3-type cytochrome oxidase subunit 3